MEEGGGRKREEDLRRGRVRGEEGFFGGEKRDDESFEAQRIQARALLFTPSLPCLRWMSLSCVGEFTVFCNLIPNKVTQQILLSQMDAAQLSPFFFFSSLSLKRRLKQDTMRRCFLHRLCRDLDYWNVSPHLHLLPLLPPSLPPFYFFSSAPPPYIHTYTCPDIPRIVTSEHPLEPF